MNKTPEETQALAETLQLFPTAPRKENAKQEQTTAPEITLEDNTKNHPHKHRTVGNKIYDWGIYTTFAWAGVAAVSALSAHEAMHGKNPSFNWLRSLNNNCISGLSKALESTIMKGKPAKTIEGWAKGSTMFVTLGMGGWAMMLPIKWMEDNREKNAARIDNFLGTTPPDPKLIEAEVPQTWGSVLEGRLMSWGLSYAAFCAMGPKVTSKVSDWFADKATQGILHVRPAPADAVKAASYIGKVKKWTNIAAFDATFTVITAAATYLFSRSIAKSNYKHLHSQDVLMTIDPATPTPQAPLLEPELAPTEPQKRFTDTLKPSDRNIAPKDDSFLKNALKSKELASTSPQLS